jgi:hypothetical protein
VGFGIHDLHSEFVTGTQQLELRTRRSSISLNNSLNKDLHLDSQIRSNLRLNN